MTLKEALLASQKERQQLNELSQFFALYLKLVSY